jgi:cytochrome o ubiquinol oxidase subunit 2
MNIFKLVFSNFALLNPKGLIALEERNLMITAVLLMLIVVIPAFIMLAVFAWKYRAGNSRTDLIQNPGLYNHSAKVVFLWWLFPSLIIFVLAMTTWHKTHALDPYKPIVSETKPITIQVVALQWKWLFIYPEQDIATVNFIQFPVNVPINFELTADNAPMNSFWIPELSGQMYAMAGMSTKLHLIANTTGDFAGSAAEISGKGFSGMRFVARASSQAEFDDWVFQAKNIIKIFK